MKAQAGVEYLVLLGVTLFLGTSAVGILVFPLSDTVKVKESQSDIGNMIRAMQYPWLSEGLVAYYKLDEQSGDTAENSAGEGDDGEYGEEDADGVLVNGTSHTKGKSGNAAKFDGENDEIKCGERRFEFGNRPHAYSIWVNISSLPNSYNYVVATGNNEFGKQSGMGVRNNGNVFLSSYGSPIVEFGAPVLGANAWYHMVLVYKGSSADLYVNGQYVGSQAIALNTSVGKCRIGSHVGDSSFFNGEIDDVRIYGRALTAEEVEFLFQNPGFP